MDKFIEIDIDTNIQDMVKSAFDMEIDIDGGWGYTKDKATIIYNTKIPLSQFEHNMTFMRAYIEMNMTLDEDKRYASINVHEQEREQLKEDNAVFDKVTYEITAILEKEYNKFISEYKEGYGKDGFDMAKHFEKRKEATLHRTVIHWFEISSISDK